MSPLALLFVLLLHCYGQQLNCSLDICSSYSQNIVCQKNGLIHINGVKCSSRSGRDCLIARINLLTLCQSQRVCVTRSLRKLFRVCDSQSDTISSIIVYYACLPDSMVINSCNNGQTTEITFPQAIISSPNFTSNVLGDNHDCLWSFSVPSGKEAEININYFSSLRMQKICPFLNLSYQVCSNLEYRFREYCSDITRPIRVRACGRVNISAKGFGRQRLLMFFRIDDPERIQELRSYPIMSLPCSRDPDTDGSDPNRNDLKTSTQTDSPYLGNNSSYVIVNDRNDLLETRFGLVIVLSVTCVIVVILLAAFIVVCYKAVALGDYRKEKKIAAHRSRAITGAVSSKNKDKYSPAKHVIGHSSIEIIPADTPNGRGRTRGQTQHNSNHNDILHFDINRVVSPSNFRPTLVASDLDDVEPLPFTTNEMRSSLENIIDAIPRISVPRYQSLSVYKDESSPDFTENWIDEEDDPPRDESLLDEVSQKSDLKETTQHNYNGKLTFLDPCEEIPHYLVNGDIYALVTKSPKTLNNKHERPNGIKASDKIKCNKTRKNGKKNLPYTCEGPYNNHIGYIQKDSDTF